MMKFIIKIQQTDPTNSDNLSLFSMTNEMEQILLHCSENIDNETLQIKIV